MTITVYRSTDASAPTLNGTVGSLITVLDACLVNGYGTRPAAGFTKPFSGTNLAVYRMTTTSPATGYYLRVDDTAAQVSRLRGFATMSDVNTGTAQFPIDAQVNGGASMRKSTSADSVARPWLVIADDRGFYMWSFGGQTIFGNSASTDSAMWFGDIATYKNTDGYQCLLVASTSTATTGDVQLLGQQSSAYSNTVGHYIARPYTGLGVSWPVSKTRRSSTGTTAGSVVGTAVTGAYPDPVTGYLDLFEIDVIEGLTVYRGAMPGMYEPYGGTLVGLNLDTFDGTGSLAGVSFILVNVYNGSSAGRVAIQTSGSWY